MYCFVRDVKGIGPKNYFECTSQEMIYLESEEINLESKDIFISFFSVVFSDCFVERGLFVSMLSWPATQSQQQGCQIFLGA
jgi:hypothetical protein